MSEIQRIGIVGDGQLGRMLTEAAIPMGYDVTVLGQAGPSSPAAQVGATQLEGGLKDADAIRSLSEQVDVVTWEIEHIDADVLMDLEEKGVNVQPSPFSLWLIQDKYRQKRHLAAWGIPVAPFELLDDSFDLPDARAKLGDKLMVKTREGGYDGRGNLVLEEDALWGRINSEFGMDAANGEPRIYAEKIIPFQRELAVVGARDMAGRIALYPVVETVHQNNICHEVFAPAAIDPRVQRDAEELGRTTIQTFEGAGVFAVEMFQDEEDNVLVNEVAPRVHNSGHHTIIGSHTSQFEQHIRAITGLPLGETGMRVPAAVMVNILGTRVTELPADAVSVSDGFTMEVNWYGKTPRAARKIGHITVGAETLDEAATHARTIRSRFDV